ncbi:MAG: ribosome maturation factor RimP [Clostridia bacterium]|nr:ribosome maturation factor RimP [Clostridia bacterium]
MASIEERVEELVKPKVEELGYELYDVQYSKEGKDYFLRIFIDNKEGIDLNDCEKVSSGINELLDESDYIKEQYFLEVSSPGIERMLRKDKHLEESIGKEIEIKLFKPFNESKEWSGILQKFDNEKIVIKNIENNEQIEIYRKNISLMKQKYNW